MILFVGNLNKLTTERELKDLFTTFGAVNKLRILVDKITHRSRGCAYVDMDDDHAQKAAQRLNCSEYMNNCIVVGMATKGQLSNFAWN
jgi:RNA recognition motif-containing protein